MADGRCGGAGGGVGGGAMGRAGAAAGGRDGPRIGLGGRMGGASAARKMDVASSNERSGAPGGGVAGSSILTVSSIAETFDRACGCGSGCDCGGGVNAGGATGALTKGSARYTDGRFAGGLGGCGDRGAATGALA